MELKQQAKQLAAENIIVDAHLDLLKDLHYQRSRGKIKVFETDYLEDFKRGGVNVVVSSIFVDDEYVPDMALRVALDQVSCLYQELEESPGIIALCKNFKDIKMAIEQEKVAILLSFEGVEPLLNDLHLLQIFYELGVRLIGMTWSRQNYAADGSRFLVEKRGREGGITEFGAKILDFAANKGMLIDLSHINDTGFWDILNLYQGPLIASHSNSRKLNDIPRNLSDDMIKAIAKTGGVIGINAISIVAAPSDDNIGLHSLVDHIEHVAQLVGPEHVGFGFDLCKKISAIYDSPLAHKMERKPFDILDDYSDIHDLLEIMIARGFSDEDIKKICGANFLRVFEKVFRR